MSRSPFRPSSEAHPLRKVGLAVIASVFLAGCGEDGALRFLQPEGDDGGAGDTAAASLVGRDVEAPDVFSVTDQGLWDGRPSLGGVWVAHPDVTEPERVIIRNEANGKFVIGALFRRERELPGPKLQISSDAAAALDILAGAPAPLEVVALRREEAAGADDTDADTLSIAPPETVAAATLDPVPSTDATQAVSAAPTPEPIATVTPQQRSATSPNRPYVQIGIFSVEENADRAAGQMRNAGMVPAVEKSEINGKPFWRVLVGPARTAAELDTLTTKIQTAGFSDAYAVAN